MIVLVSMPVAGRALRSPSLPTPVSVPMETEQDVPGQLQSLNLTLYGALIKLLSIAIP